MTETSRLYPNLSRSLKKPRGTNPHFNAPVPNPRISKGNNSVKLSICAQTFTYLETGTTINESMHREVSQ